MLPLGLGGLLIAVLTLFGDVPWLNDALGDAGLYLVLAWAVCGVPYLLVAAGFMLWSKGRHPDLVRRGLLAVPLILAVLSVVWWFGYLLLNHGTEDRPLQWDSLALLFGKIIGIVLVVGYAYVGIALVVAARLGHGQVQNDAA